MAALTYKRTVANVFKSFQGACKLYLSRLIFAMCSFRDRLDLIQNEFAKTICCAPGLMKIL